MSKTDINPGTPGERTAMVAKEMMAEDIMKLVGNILDHSKPQTDPAKYLVEVGNALVKIGKVLDGVPLAKSRKILRAVQVMTSND